MRPGDAVVRVGERWIEPGMTLAKAQDVLLDVCQADSVARRPTKFFIVPCYEKVTRETIAKDKEKAKAAKKTTKVSDPAPSIIEFEDSSPEPEAEAQPDPPSGEAVLPGGEAGDPGDGSVDRPVV